MTLTTTISRMEHMMFMLATLLSSGMVMLTPFAVIS